ncbi:hypothetical protein BUALT_Bualt01G0200800 [Buddleja alternifolia]|uniref:Uncharacterized protein n=1 Tax=Buddleja alternifolia TaxID=168488 RepID=A0AAV6YCT6_9LAMI|nr:hypothetical protein BUALT_Bualt01G0200800 [Buddleja alternifolia]
MKNEILKGLAKSISSAGIATTNRHHLLHRNNVQYPAQFYHALRRSHPPTHHHHSISIIQIQSSISPKSMADESKKMDIQAEKDESIMMTTLSVTESKEEKETEKSTPSIPPLSEKPLLGIAAAADV